MEITLTRALSELKTLEARIQKEVQNSKFMAVMFNDKFVDGPLIGYSKDQFTKDFAVSSRDKIADLIKRRKLLKREIVKANAVNFVKIAEEQYTISEAIDKKYFCKHVRVWFDKILRDISLVENSYNTEKMNHELKRQAVLEASVGKEGKVNQELIKSVTEGFDAANRLELVDPIKIREWVESEIESIENFESEVDFVLSEANSTIKIDI